MAKIKIKINLKTVNIWMEAIIWTLWTITVYGHLRIGGASILMALFFIATPHVMRKTETNE